MREGKLLHRYRFKVLGETWSVEVTEEEPYGDRDDPRVPIHSRVALVNAEGHHVYSLPGPPIREGDITAIMNEEIARRKAERRKRPKKYKDKKPLREDKVLIRLQIEVELEREQGKFASREELTDAVVEAAEQADPGTVEGENEGQYSVVRWDVEAV